MPKYEKYEPLTDEDRKQAELEVEYVNAILAMSEDKLRRHLKELQRKQKTTRGH